MSVRNIFSHKKKLSQRKFGRLYSKDTRMREVFGNQKIAKALDKTSEKNEFYDMLKSKKEGGVTKQEMKEALGEWMSGKGRTISRKEAYTVAKEFFGDEKVKYVMPKKKQSSSAYGGNSGAFGGAGGASQNIQKSYGSFGSIHTGANRPVISASGLPTIYKKAPADPASRTPKILASSVSSAKIVQPAANGSSTSAQSAQEKEERAESARKAQSTKRKRSISAGLAAIVDMMGPVKSEDKKNNKGDFFRAINATRKRGNG